MTDWGPTLCVTGPLTPMSICISLGKFFFFGNYKNPCWRQKSVLYCLPYFYLMGVPKCGTSDLYRRIVKHPLISANVQKGNHWIARRRFENLPALSDYLHVFENTVNTDITGILTRTGFHNAIFGDFTPSVIWDHRGLLSEAIWRNMTEPPYTNADLIKRLNPNAKIIVAIRNPVDRSDNLKPDFFHMIIIIFVFFPDQVNSEYLFFKETDDSPADFHTRVVNSTNNMSQCLKDYGIRACVYFGRPNMYYREMYQNIFTFLDVGPISDKKLFQEIISNTKYNKRTKADQKLGDMLPETRTLLSNFYKPYNQRLAVLLGSEFDYNRE
ncbi:carbohydrate sulfotransferase 15-like [Mercenaria mercenaria]|uniref:carbohydrate sulfotransferase 15-like n=1 Tax=Mercenaria mercenaria TaxID=6596 RepID=UPI00234F50F5|nr:carbohydrate sulfotransferase 15-like [Mercenaria mercenaria]